eukprot:6456381-Amphidinium_carterae.1
MQYAYSQGDFQQTRQLLERARHQGRSGARERGRVAMATAQEAQGQETAGEAYESLTRAAASVPVPSSEDGHDSTFEVSDVRIYNDLQLLMTVVARLLPDLHLGDGNNNPRPNPNNARQPGRGRGTPYTPQTSKGSGQGRGGSRVYITESNELNDDSSAGDWETLSVSEAMDVDFQNDVNTLGAEGDDAGAADAGGIDMEEAISTLIWDIPEEDQELQQSLNQALVLATNAKQRARGRGGKGAAGRRGRGSGSSMSASAAASGAASSSSSAARSAVDARKKTSTCRVCGLKGHWAGDPQCQGVRGNKPHESDVLMITWDCPAVSAYRTSQVLEAKARHSTDHHALRMI